MKLAVSIVGTGAIGGLLISRCHEQNIEFNRLTRSGEKTPLTLEMINQEKQVLSPNTDPLTTGVIHDIVIIPVKAYQIRAVISQLAPRLSKNVCIVLLHNGMGSCELIEREFPNLSTIIATTSHSAYKPSIDCIKQTGIGQSQFGWLQISGLDIDKQKSIELLIENLLFPASLLDDMQTALWKKLAVNASINPITACLKLTNGQLTDPRYLSIIHTICQEISEVAIAKGFKLFPNELIDNVRRVIEDTADNYSSMYQDIIAFRKTEIDSINGYVVNAAKALNIQVPETKRWLKKIKSIEANS